MTDSVEARWERHNEAGKRLLGAGEFAAAEQAFIAAVREATLLGADNERLATSLSHLGQLKTRQKEFAQAEALFRRALAIRERVLGKDHPSLIPAINNLASVQAAAGNVAQAEPLFRRALELNDRAFGEQSAAAAAPLNSLARLLFRRNDYAAAAPLLTRLLAIKEEALGANHPEVAAILTSLARVRTAEGDHAAAEQLARRALAIREQTESANSPVIATSLDALAEVCAARGKPDEAMQLRVRAQAIRGPAGVAAPGVESLPARAPEPVADRKLTPPFVRQVSRAPRRTPPPRDSLPWVQPTAPVAPSAPTTYRASVAPAAPVAPLSTSASLAPPAPLAASAPPAPAAPRGARMSPELGTRRTSAPVFAPTTMSTTGSMSAIMVPLGAADIFTSQGAMASRSSSTAELAQHAHVEHQPAPAPVRAAATAAAVDEMERPVREHTADAIADSSDRGAEPSFRFRRTGWRAPQWLSDPRRPWLKAMAGTSVLVILGASAWALTPHASSAHAVTPTTSTVQSEQGATLAPAPQPAAPEPSVPTEADRMATATMPQQHPDAPRSAEAHPGATHAASDSHADRGDADSVVLPQLPKIRNVDKVTNAIGERATNRVDSLSRTVTIKPPTFGKP